MLKGIRYWKGDDAVNRIRAQKTLFIEKKITDYQDNLTIHGLTRSVKGKRIESTIWISILLMGVVCIVVVIDGLIKKYNSHLTYTEMKSQITDKNYFPSITFCEETLLRSSYFSFCGDHISRSKRTEGCSSNHAYRKADVREAKHKFWSNGLFNVTRCQSWGGKHCEDSKHFKSKQETNHSCIIFNYDDHFYDSYSHVDINFEFRRPIRLLSDDFQVFALPHDPRILEIDLTKKIDIDSGRQYSINIDKTIIKRLPAPFPSNCTVDESGNIFPGKYTRSLCIESHFYIEMFKRCGSVFDYHSHYIPKHIRETWGRNSTNAIECILNHTKEELETVQECHFPCETLDLNYIASAADPTRDVEDEAHNEGDVVVYRYKVAVQLKSAQEYKIMEEKPLYTLSQMACEIGGFVGVIMGMSVISLVEVIVIVLLSIVKKIL